MFSVLHYLFPSSHLCMHIQHQSSVSVYLQTVVSKFGMPILWNMKEYCQFFFQENGRAAWCFYKIGCNEVLPGLHEWRYIIPFLSIWILNDFNLRIKKDYWYAVYRLLYIFLQIGWLTLDTEIRKPKDDNRNDLLLYWSSAF